MDITHGSADRRKLGGFLLINRLGVEVITQGGFSDGIPDGNIVIKIEVY